MSASSRSLRDTLAAVVVTAAAFALYARVEWPWFVLGWVGLVPWLATLDRLATIRGALASGLAMSVAFVLGVFAWFAIAVAGYGDLPVSVGFAVLILLAPVVQPQFVVFAAVRHLARRYWGEAGAAFAGAGAYVGTEWLTGKLFGDTLGHGFYASVWLRQAADIGGAPGLTFVLVLFNECVLLALRGAVRMRKERGVRPTAGSATGCATVARDLRAMDRTAEVPHLALPVAAAVALVLLPLGYGMVRYRTLTADAPGTAPVTVGLVQADIGQYGRLAAERGTYDAVRYILNSYFALSADALERARLDLLLWPETVYPTTFGKPKSADGAAFDAELARLVAVTGVPLVFGAYDADGDREFNAAVLLEPEGNGRVAFETYRKAWLFPLTERVPAWMDRPWLRARFPWLGTWTPGDGSRVLDVRLADGRTLRVSPLICYDAVDPQIVIAAVRQGAEMIATLSNDSWFSVGGGPLLHLIVSSFRSLETRRPQVRVTNTGISTVIAPTGEWLGTLDVHARGTVVQAVTPVNDRSTLMLRWGDWFGPTAGLAAVVLLGIGVARGPRR